MGLDEDLLRFINQGLASPFLDPLMVGLSIVGLSYVWVLIVIPLWRSDHRPEAIDFLLLFVAVELITWALKLAVDRPRATGLRVVAPYLPTPLDPSFPSGHASRTFASAGLLGHRLRRWRWPLYALATGIGFSRIYLGIHYPSDVLAGALLGLGAAVAYLLLAERWPPLAHLRKRALEVLEGLVGKLGQRPQGVEDLFQGGRGAR